MELMALRDHKEIPGHRDHKEYKVRKATRATRDP